MFAPATGGGLFGAATGGGFGNSGGSLFGNGKTFDKPAGSLFGQANNMFSKPADGSKPSTSPDYGEGEPEEDENYVTADEPPSIAIVGDSAA